MYAIDSMHGNELTTGIQLEVEARRIAQRHADRLGECVYLYEVGSDDEAEEIQPGVNTTRWGSAKGGLQLRADVARRLEVANGYFAAGRRLSITGMSRDSEKYGMRVAEACWLHAIGYSLYVQAMAVQREVDSWSKP